MKKIIILIFIFMTFIFVSCFGLFTKEDEPARYMVSTTNDNQQRYICHLYNSSDGNCNISGEDISFYINNQFIVKLSAGKNAETRLFAGNHLFQAFDMRGNVVYEMNLSIKGDGAYFWAGCKDGTHPN